MWDYIIHAQRATIKFISHMDQTQFAIAAAVACVIGFICMRGFGSRSNY